MIIYGFTSVKDILEILLPAAIALIALFWPNLQALHRRRVFTRLILRELEELMPFPREPQDGQQWWAHQRRQFVHRRIFAGVSANRDFILSLDPTLVYYVSQLWDALDNHEADQWLWYLKNIAQTYDRRGDIKENHTLWSELIEAYSQKAKNETVAKGLKSGHSSKA
jgi:hypothetical protein